MGNNVIEDNQIDSEKLNATVIALAIRLAFLGLLLFLSLSIIRPFIETVAWSVVWAVALYPVFDLVARWLGGRRRLAAALITVLLLLIVFGPVTWLGRDLLEVPRTISESLETGSISVPPPIEAVKNWPLIGEPLFQFWELASSNLKAALVTVAPYLKPLGSTLLGAAGSVGAAILQFIASVIIAGFLLSPGPSLVEAVASFLHRRVSSRGDASSHHMELDNDGDINGAHLYGLYGAGEFCR
jgi:predicted PurR-regulated permease PerM